MAQSAAKGLGIADVACKGVISDAETRVPTARQVDRCARASSLTATTKITGEGDESNSDGPETSAQRGHHCDVSAAALGVGDGSYGRRRVGAVVDEANDARPGLQAEFARQGPWSSTLSLNGSRLYFGSDRPARALPLDPLPVRETLLREACVETCPRTRRAAKPAALQAREPPVSPWQQTPPWSLLGALPPSVQSAYVGLV